MTTPRQMIRHWWRDRLAQAAPCDIEQTADEAVAALLADERFRASLAELIRPLVLDIGQRVAYSRVTPRGQRSGAVQVGGQVMTREQAVALVDETLRSPGRPAWSQLVQTEEGPALFLALTKRELIAESRKRRDSGHTQLREAAFLFAVANNLTDNQIVGEVWREEELDQLYQRIEVDFRPRLKPERAIADGAQAA